MKLKIDTSSREVIVVEVDGRRFEKEAIKEKSQALLPLIIDSLSECGVTLSDLTEIEVNTGPGSFTGLRIGVTVASVLGSQLGIPVNGRNIVKDGTPEIDYGNM